MITAVLLALLAHVGYATNDFSGALASRKLDGRLITLCSWTVSSVLYAVIAPFFFRPKFLLLPLLSVFLLALLFSLAYPIFLKSVEKGNPTISGVVAGTFPLWTVIFSVILFDEKLTVVQTAFIAVIVVGIILSALHLSNKTRIHNLFNRYTLLAFAVSVVWGFCFALWKYPVGKLGWFETSFINSIFAVIICFALFYRYFGGKIWVKFKSNQKYVVVNSVTGVVGTVAYSLALMRGTPSVIAPIAGSYGGLYAILSYYTFRERLTKLQFLGVVLTLCGVIGLSVILSRS